MLRPIAVLAAFWLFLIPAAAQEQIDGSDPEAIAELMRGYGSARIDVAADKTPAIRGRIDGTAFSVFFYGCDESDANCTSISFSAGWSMAGVDVEAVNAWNRDKRFGRGYIDDVGEPILEMDVNLFGSVTVENLDDTIDWWRVVLADFEANVIAPAQGDGSEPSQDGLRL